MKKAVVKLKSYRKGRLDAKEMDLMDKWLFDYRKDERLFFSEEEIRSRESRMLSSLLNRIHKKESIRWPKISVAASIVFALIVGGWFYYQSERKSDLKKLSAYTAIKPGRNAATLTLGNGKKILLDEKGVGELALESGVRISKNGAGELVYTITDQASAGNNINILATSNGETAKVILPDGTKVWLNAASSITYPSSFVNALRRRVSLEGEAYFEAAHDAKHPFVVRSNGQDVEVLGTHFDVSAYLRDGFTKTTLLQGSVRVTGDYAKEILVPGEQSVLAGNGEIIKRKVNVNAAVDWKDGFFTFDDEPLEVMMDKIGRWYNVKIVFKDEELKKINVYARFSRFDNLGKIKEIEKSGRIKFELRGDVLTIAKP